MNNGDGGRKSPSLTVPIAILLAAMIGVIGGIIGIFLQRIVLRDPLICPEHIPSFICGETFRNIISKYPSILNPLESFISKKILFDKHKEGTLTLKSIEDNKAVFELELTSSLINIFDHTISDEISMKGDIEGDPILKIFNERNDPVNVHVKEDVDRKGMKFRSYSTVIQVPPGQIFTLKTKLKIKRELSGEYAIFTIKPILNYYSMKFVLDKSVDDCFVIRPYESTFDLIEHKPYADKQNSISTIKIDGPLFPGQGFIPSWNFVGENIKECLEKISP